MARIAFLLALSLLVPLALATGPSGAGTDPRGDQETDRPWSLLGEAGAPCSDPASDVVATYVGVSGDDLLLRATVDDLDGHPTCGGAPLPVPASSRYLVFHTYHDGGVVENGTFLEGGMYFAALHDTVTGEQYAAIHKVVDGALRWAYVPLTVHAPVGNEWRFSAPASGTFVDGGVTYSYALPSSFTYYVATEVSFPAGSMRDSTFQHHPQ